MVRNDVAALYGAESLRTSFVAPSPAVSTLPASTHGSSVWWTAEGDGVIFLAWREELVGRVGFWLGGDFHPHLTSEVEVRKVEFDHKQAADNAHTIDDEQFGQAVATGIFVEELE